MDSVRLKLKMAEVEKKITNVSRASSHRNIEDNYKKESGKDLFNIESMKRSPPVEQMNYLKTLLEGVKKGEEYDVEPYTYRIPSLGSQV